MEESEESSERAARRAAAQASDSVPIKTGAGSASPQVSDGAAAETGADGVPVGRRVLEYVGRCVLLCIGLFVMSVGVGLSVQANLGTSPISSVPTVLWKITGLSLGTTTIIFNVLIVLIQVLLLRRRFRPLQLLQIPICILFGLLCDASLSLLGGVAPTEYWLQWLVCVAGILLVAAGVSMEVAANVSTLPGEGLALAMCKLFPKVRFGYMKVLCDSSFVVVAAALSLLFLYKLDGVREGTVAAAIFVGLIARQFNRFVLPLAGKFFAWLRGGPSVGGAAAQGAAR